MEIPTGNFFEVTINSNKLFESIQKLQQQLQEQDTAIKTIDGTIQAIEDSIWDKIN